MASTPLVSPSSAGAQPSIEDQIAAADAELKAAQAKLAQTFAAFTAAEDRHKKATAAARSASAKAAQAASAAATAEKDEQALRQEFDQFTSANYRQGTMFNSISAYMTADSPSELLDRASLLRGLSGTYGNVLGATQQAVDRKATTASQAQATKDKAVRDRDAAAKTKADAAAAYKSAVAVQDKAKAETAQLAARRAGLAGSGGDDASAPVTGGVARPAVGTFTSGYGARGGTIHYGVDIANSIGTPIFSAMAGDVIDSGPASGFGLWVRVDHGNGLITVYGHINGSLVSVGQSVAAGEQIATMGNRGQSTGPHLHFEVHEDGNKIDPQPWLSARGVNL
jgi:murein DD-endopeptidase MepM/ murein hydrolase activator NlpD